jgi:hypothetical protein
MLIADQIERGEELVRQCAARLTEAQGRLRQATTEVESLAALRQQQWEAHRAAVARVQQEQLDEVGLRRWLAAKASGGEARGEPPCETWS